MEREQKLKIETDYPRLVGGRFFRQGSLYTRFVMVSCKPNRSLYLPARTLKVYTEALTEFSKVFSPDGLNIALLS